MGGRGQRWADILFLCSNSHDIRKSIARVLTVINAKQRAQLRLFYKSKKYMPLDLRAKQTRAIRRRLSKEDASRVLEKTKKRQTHFPQRKFAVKVRDIWRTGEREGTCPAVCCRWGQMLTGRLGCVRLFS